VQHLGLISQVTFAGKMRDWSATDEVMHGADYYIMPAPTDRFTANRLLAMAAGLAIVAPAGTTEDYLIDGETASLFDPHRPQDLATKWLALLEDRAAARQLAHGALDHVRAHHQASTMVTATAFLYRQVCDSGVHL
jgi:glycosyltransferase involved in cell wall biosynthesis